MGTTFNRVTLNALTSVNWGIASLFSNGEQGVYFDSSDFSTMFQDSAGTTPVTAVEQPVGLILDKSKGLILGNQLFANSGFDSGTTGWTTSLTFSAAGGIATVTNSSGMTGYLYQSIGAAANKVYELSVVVTSVSGTVRLVLNGGVGTSSSALSTGTTTVRFQNSSANGNAGLELAIGASISIDTLTIREVFGNHAYQATSGSRPVLSARYNLLTYTEQFDIAVWSKDGILAFGSGSVANMTTAPDGTTTADLIIPTAANSYHRLYSAAGISIISGNSYTFSVYVKASGYEKVAFRETSTTGSYASFLLSGAGSILDKSASANATIIPVGNGWYFITFNIALVATTITWGFHVLSPSYTSGNPIASWLANGIDGIYLWGADLRATNDGAGLPVYQRVVDNNTYDTNGFPPYLKFDGSNDSLVTSSIDFSSTDKMSVFAGARRLTDTNGIIAELSATTASNSGAFVLMSYLTGWLWRTRGTTDITGAITSTPLAPATNLLTGQGIISTDLCTLRANGSQVATDTGDQGSGNFGNYPLYIGARAGSSNFFNGRLHQLIIRGAASSDREIKLVEEQVNQKTKAY